MFSWARREKLSQRKSLSNSAKSCVETTEPQSHPSSPAHSAFSINSPAKYMTPEKKLKVVLYKKEKEKKRAREYAGNIDHSITKSQLINMINIKSQNNENKKPPLAASLNPDCSNARKTIKIKIEVNKLLDEYCRVVKQIASNDPWGIFGVALVMLQMGFIQDLVNDRDIVKDVWAVVGHPDKFCFYVFLEQAIGNKVHIDMALSSISAQLEIAPSELNKEAAIRIISQRRCSQLYETLKLNRLCRQKKQTLK